MLYCNHCKEEPLIYYEPPEPSIGLPESAEFACCSGDNVWRLPDYYLQKASTKEDWLEWLFAHPNEWIEKNFPDIKKIDVWTALKVLHKSH